MPNHEVIGCPIENKMIPWIDTNALQDQSYFFRMNAKTNQILKDYVASIEQIWDSLPLAIVEEFSNHSNMVFYPKNTYIMSAGEICRYLYVIESGGAWKFYTNNGIKIPTDFAFTKEIIFSFQSYTTQSPSIEYIQTLEDSYIQQIEYGVFEEFRKKYPILSQLDTLFLEYQILRLEDRLQALQFNTAEQRLLWLLQRESKLFDKVPQKHIAAYLGMTLETLVRLKKRINTKS
ncbi:Crp/Fnr family transcriptional regulator [Leptospira ryugenii]|nr:Crp/Fnr family transcriptional regulator [Leptospira ryugenii]